MGFQTPPLMLVDLLRDVGTGKIQLPDFQRGYKWDDERIRSLLVTVLRGHPMGALMLLDTGNDNIHFKPQPLARVTDDAAVDEHRALRSPNSLLLDGQQRMTSLYQALTGSGIVGTKDSRGKEMARRYFLDVELALGDPSEQDDAVRSLSENGVVRANFERDIVEDYSTFEKQTAAGLMPLTTLFGDDTLDWLLEYREARDGDHRRAVVREFNEQIVRPLHSYAIPTIVLDRDTTKEAVATVFNKVNSGGLRLDNFELLTAIFAGDADYFEAHGDYFRLREDWGATGTMLREHRSLHEVKATDFLQAVLLLATLDRQRADIAQGKAKPAAVSARGDDTLKLTLSEYLAWAPKVRAALPWVANFYTAHHIHTAWDLPYRTQTVPLVVFRVLLGNEIDIIPVRQRISRWFWCGVFGELYGSTTETRFARDVEQVPGWALAAKTGTEVPEPVTIKDANLFESRLMSLRSRLSAAYKGVYALLMAQGCRDWREDKVIDHATFLDLQIDIHHVFPQKWCNDNYVSDADRETIVNKTPLSKRTNIFLRGDSPAVYVPRLEADTHMPAAQVNELISGHLIDPGLLRAADFPQFLKVRREALCLLIGEVMGKAVIRDIVVENGVERGVEDASAFEPEADADDLGGADDVQDAEATA